MKKIIIATVSLITACLPLTLFAQTGYTITGKLSQLNVPAKAILLTIQNGSWKSQDSMEVKNGKFQFQGNVAEPKQAIVSLIRSDAKGQNGSNDYVPLFLENAKITLTATDSVKNAKVEGSKADKEYKELEALKRPFNRHHN